MSLDALLGGQAIASMMRNLTPGFTGRRQRFDALSTGKTAEEEDAMIARWKGDVADLPQAPPTWAFAGFTFMSDLLRPATAPVAERLPGWSESMQARYEYKQWKLRTGSDIRRLLNTTMEEMVTSPFLPRGQYLFNPPGGLSHRGR